jgi:hypothetical protein
MATADDDRPMDSGLSTADLASPGSAQEAQEPMDRERETSGPEGGREEGEGSTEMNDQPLLPPDRANDFVARWERIQATFVDEPRSSVEQADHLVAELMQVLAEGFSQERSNLEGQWSRGGDVSTEDLRVALQRYRSFFRRLLEA